MAPLTTEEQFTFLISCIRHSNAGKIEWDKVATECGIVSKGAAAKHYERLMKAHGIVPNSGGSGQNGGEAPATPAKRKAANGEKKITTGKKRKLDVKAEDEDDGDSNTNGEVKAEAVGSDGSEG